MSFLPNSSNPRRTFRRLGTILLSDSEIDTMFAGMKTRVFHLPGNHDVSNPLQQKVWRQRYGPTYSHFRYRDALFCLLDTQDPPHRFPDEQVDTSQTPAGLPTRAERASPWRRSLTGTVSSPPISVPVSWTTGTAS